MRLLCEGYLTLHDVFSQDAPFGVFTGTGLVREAIAMQPTFRTKNQLIFN